MMNKILSIIFLIFLALFFIPTAFADDTDWSQPTTTTLFSAFPDKVKDLAKSAAMMSYEDDTNIPTNVMRYNRSTDQLEQYNGSTWDAQEITNLKDGSVTNDTVSSGSLQREVLDLDEAWATFTPTMRGTSSYTPATPTLTGKVAYLGKIITFAITGTWNSATGSGNPVFQLPSGLTMTTALPRGPVLCVVTTNGTSDMIGVGVPTSGGSDPNGAWVITLAGGSGVSFGTGFSSFFCNGVFER